MVLEPLVRAYPKEVFCWLDLLFHLLSGNYRITH